MRLFSLIDLCPPFVIPISIAAEVAGDPMSATVVVLPALSGSAAARPALSGTAAARPL